MRFSYCQCVILHFECLKTSYKEFLTHTRQHRHLKRKDSIRFLVLLVFSVFFIFTGQRNDFSLARCACVTTYSKAAMPLSNLFGVYGSSPPASDSRLPRGYIMYP